MKTEIESVNIIGANLIPEAEIRKAINIKPGDVYNDVDISDARYRVIDLYNKWSYRSSCISKERKSSGKKHPITFQIDEGTEILFGKTIITGNNNTKYSGSKKGITTKRRLCLLITASLPKKDRSFTN